MTLVFKKSIRLIAILVVFSSHVQLAQAQTPLSCLRKNVIGKWVGLLETPWIHPYQVRIEFKADGTYSSFGSLTCFGQTETHPCYPTKLSGLYYGIDGESSNKKYSIQRAPRGIGSGTIDIAFFRDGQGNRSPLSQIEIHVPGVDENGMEDMPVNFCQNSNGQELPKEAYLFMTFKHNGYGPLKLNLKRVRD